MQENNFLKNELLRDRKDETDGLGNSSRKKYLLGKTLGSCWASNENICLGYFHK